MKQVDELFLSANVEDERRKNIWVGEVVGEKFVLHEADFCFGRLTRTISL